MKERGQKRPWHDLPDDLLTLISAKLGLADRVRFSAVCTCWQHIQDATKIAHTIKKLPLLITFQKDSTGIIRYELLDPLCRDNPTVEFSSILFRTTILASKYGWLLLENYGLGGDLFFSLFSPFTNEIIELPPYGFIGGTHYTFSSIPTSQDCVVFAAYCIKCSGIISISIIKLQNNMEYNGSFSLGFDDGYHELRSVAYVQGYLYCVFVHGWLGRFSLKDLCWTMVANKLPFSDETSLGKYLYLFESNGRVLLAALIPQPSKSCTRLKFYCFDETLLGWVSQESLKDQVLFLSTNSTFVLTDLEVTKKVYRYKVLGEENINSLDINKGKECELYDWIAEEYSTFDGQREWIQRPD